MICDNHYENHPACEDGPLLLLYAFRQQAFSCNAWLTLVWETQKANTEVNFSLFSTMIPPHNRLSYFKQTQQEEKLLMLKKNGKQLNFYSFLNATLFIRLVETERKRER